MRKWIAAEIAAVSSGPAAAAAAEAADASSGGLAEDVAIAEAEGVDGQGGSSSAGTGAGKSGPVHPDSAGAGPRIGTAAAIAAAVSDRPGALAAKKRVQAGGATFVDSVPAHLRGAHGALPPGLLKKKLQVR